MSEDGDNFVTYGEPFEEDDAENSTFMHPKSRPQAYEQRVLNERGRPMRFHGAFTGGFSAGYFNTVGSREGFKPQSFTSSRRNRDQNVEQQVLSKPEDFMDEEDLGEFGIAPRHYRTRREFDDHHIFSTLSESLGGKSVIPDASDILKRMLIPGGTSLADRLLRRMGWKSDELAAVLRDEDNDDESETVETDETNKSSSTRERDYAVITFAPKINTFGLGYSGLDPEIAMGRRAPTSQQDPRLESVGALQKREQMAHVGFNPSTAPVRQGIHGQAFGVGALHSEDADIYAQDSLASYDFSIGPGDNDNNEDDDDDEMAELEAARHGRFSDLRKKTKGKTTIDGWTPPTLPKVSLSGVEEEDTHCDLLDGFVKPVESGACLVLANAEFFVIPKPVVLPPGYNPVFHPECLGGVAKEEVSEISAPVPPVVTPSTPLLKPFVNDSSKQARFEAYQLLIRQGLSHEDAYKRCSIGAMELTTETRGFEANVFATLLRNLAPLKTNSTPSTLTDSTLLKTPSMEMPKTRQLEPQNRDDRPLTAGILDAEKQRLVANLLKSRFRSAGEMDVTKELTEAQEEERRKDLESLDMTDPRDSAAANESYGVLTRRTLTWHPAALLCKRVNVPNPYPDSTFVGCPEDRRMRRPPRRGRKRHRDDVTSNEFTLFQLLDINVGNTDNGVGDFDDDIDSDEEEEAAEIEAKDEQPPTDIPVPSTKIPSGPPPSIFDALFDESEKAQRELALNETVHGPSKPSAPVPRVIGPAAPPTNALKTDKSGGPSMDLFKSVFASDEELDDNDDDIGDDVEIGAGKVEPALESSEFRPSVVSTGGDNLDNTDSLEEVPTSPPSKSSVPDLSVHQLFKHLFDPQIDNEAPLFAVSKVTHQRIEERRSKEEETRTSATKVSSLSEEDFYGPSLPPNFGPSSDTSFSTSTLEISTNPSSDNVVFVEKKPRRNATEKEKHRSQKHGHKHHHHRHKHRRGDKD